MSLLYVCAVLFHIIAIMVLQALFNLALAALKKHTQQEKGIHNGKPQIDLIECLG